MRLSQLLPPILAATLGLLSACGGSGSSSRGSAPSAATVQQATAITTSQVSTLKGLMPTGLVPPIAGPRGYETTAPSHLLPNPLSRQDLEGIADHLLRMQSKVVPPLIAPCTAVYTTSTDGNGVTTDTFDYTACTDGFGGKMILVYQYTQTAWRYDITFDKFAEAYTYGADTYRSTINGSLTFGGTLDSSGNSYTFTYKTGSGGMTMVTTKNGATLTNATFTQDTTCKWLVTTRTPVVATFTVYGTWSYTGTFVNEGSAITSGAYGFAIPQATPLVWNYDGSSTTNCAWPTSGVINITNGSEALSFTFTSTCGQAILNPGNKTVTF